MTLAERFTAAVELAMVVDTPAQILRRILADPVDNGLRAANLDGKIRGGDKLSHPERLALDERQKPKRARHLDEALALRKAGDRVLCSVQALLAICVDRGPGDLEAYGWAEAVKDAHLLDQMGVVATAIDLDRDGANGVAVNFCDGVDELEQIARRWPRVTGREPSDIEQAWTNDLADERCCRLCLQVEPVGVVRVERHRGSTLCRTCLGLREAAEGIDPPLWLVAVWHDCNRRGQSIVWRAARSRWLESMGVRSA